MAVVNLPSQRVADPGKVTHARYNDTVAPGQPAQAGRRPYQFAALQRAPAKAVVLPGLFTAPLRPRRFAVQPVPGKTPKTSCWPKRTALTWPEP